MIYKLDLKYNLYYLMYSLVSIKKPLTNVRIKIESFIWEKG